MNDSLIEKVAKVFCDWSWEAATDSPENYTEAAKAAIAVVLKDIAFRYRNEGEKHQEIIEDYASENGVSLD